MRRLAAWVFATALAASPLSAKTIAQYRAFWVDTFNSALNNHDDIVAVVNGAKAAKANAIFAQVRRRGDAFYLDSIEPAPDFLPIPAGYDVLRDLITTAHADGIEVHAFVIIGAIWNKNPNVPRSETGGPPIDARHVFNRHGGYDPETKRIVSGPDNWLTRMHPQFGLKGSTFSGYRFGNDFWIDLGHPAAADYTYNVLMHLVRSYDIDGLHLDRIRYPEVDGPAQTRARGANVGYNPRNVERYQQHYGIAAGAPPPEPNDKRWSQWRRDQVTNFVRRVYLNAIDSKPALKVSAALVVYGGGPSSEDEWPEAEAYWRVFQDWRAWTEEGILDIAVPMNYKRDRDASVRAQFDQWSEWMRNHQYNRSGLIGIGGFMNAVQATVRQTRRALEPSPVTGNNVAGVSFFSMARTRPTIATAFDEHAAVPQFAWKSAPSTGHLMGFAPYDTGRVTIAKDGVVVRTTASDGNGFFGAVDLQPGTYIVNVQSDYSCTAHVTAGKVARCESH